MLKRVRSAWTFFGVSTTPSEGSDGPMDTLPEALFEVLLVLSAAREV